ncbi:hypothetical protein MNV_30012 [Candidatus Methanoperedens nitroreducens]|uniref:Uncharacterized protein n=1 Tax=Candidatus Methanoperedens nitratireducens TaxID=1392998 RepID=A0A284VPX8_9EURY|nr:hypothetical protein MNV_30012 [Candidatus Methanoperedens nitroreducens]
MPVDGKKEACPAGEKIEPDFNICRAGSTDYSGAGCVFLCQFSR